MHVDDGAAWELIDDRIMCVRWRVMKPAVALKYIDDVERTFSTGKLSAGLWVIEPGLRPPDETIRKRFAQMSEKGDALFAGGAFVVEGNTMSSAVVRSVLTGIIFLARSKTRTQVAHSVVDGAMLVRDWFNDPPPSATIKNDGYVVDVKRLVDVHTRLLALLDQQR